LAVDTTVAIVNQLPLVVFLNGKEESAFVVGVKRCKANTATDVGAVGSGEFDSNILFSFLIFVSKKLDDVVFGGIDITWFFPGSETGLVGFTPAVAGWDKTAMLVGVPANQRGIGTNIFGIGISEPGNPGEEDEPDQDARSLHKKEVKYMTVVSYAERDVLESWRDEKELLEKIEATSPGVGTNGGCD